MRSWQIRNILAAIAMIACCGVATAGTESAPPKQPQTSSEVQSESKQQTKKATPVRKKGKAKSTSKSAATAKTEQGAGNKVKPPEKVAVKTLKPAPKVEKAVSITDKPAPKVKKAASITDKPVPMVERAAAITDKPAPRLVKAPALAGKYAKAPAPGSITVAPSSTGPPNGMQETGFKDRARWAPTQCIDTDKSLEGTVRAIDKEASRGDGKVGGRMAEEFRVPPEALLSERTRLSAGWGELVVAHTLLANTKSGVTIDQLFDMRAEGMGWGQIAHGLGLKQNDVVKAVRTEGQVMRGKSKPDGSAAPIASLEPQDGLDGTMHSGAPTSEAGATDTETTVPETAEE
jgi:hypothetical protein